jgi:hypothetical protein
VAAEILRPYLLIAKPLAAPRAKINDPGALFDAPSR